MKKIFDIGNGKNNPWGTYAQAIDDNFTELSDNVNKKQDKLTISQTTGQSTTAVMSQKAVTDALDEKPGKVIDDKGEVFNAVDNNSAEGVNAHAEGFGNAANGEASHVEGIGNTADGYVSHAEGKDNKATDSAAHAEGKENKASGSPAHAEGYQTEASGAASHTEGKLTKASGPYAHAEGEGTIAQNTAEHACGRYNVSGGGVTQWSVGIGTSDDDRKNAAEIRTDGKLYLLGLGGYDGKSAYGKKSVQEVISEAGSGDFLILNIQNDPEETTEWAKAVFGEFNELAKNHPVYQAISVNKKKILAVKENNPYTSIAVTLHAQYISDRTSSVVFTLSYLKENSYYIVEVTYKDGGSYTTKVLNKASYVVNLTSAPNPSAEWAESVFGYFIGTPDTHPLYLAVKNGQPLQCYLQNGNSFSNISASINVSLLDNKLQISLEYVSAGYYYLLSISYSREDGYSTTLVRNIPLSELLETITSLSSRIPTVIQSTGTSTTSVMSQDAVTKAINNREDIQFIDLGNINTEYPSDDTVGTIISTVLKKSEVQEFISNTNSKIAYICFMSQLPMIMVIERNFTSTVNQGSASYGTYRLESTESEFGTIYSGKFRFASSSSSFYGSIDKITTNYIGGITI